MPLVKAIMLMLIPIQTRRRTYLWNPADGTLTRLGELETAILGESVQPMPPVCPTSLRYAVAKYDSAEVDSAYAALRARFAAAAEPSDTRKLTIESGTSTVIGTNILRAVMAACPGQCIALEADAELLAAADALGFVRA